MPIVNIIRRASNYILGSEELQDKNDTLFEDNEVLFCKNNVCVHPPALVRQESDILHYPGYLTVTTKTFTDQYNNAKRPTLLLTWIPNATLRKCPSTVENYGITSTLLGNGAATNANTNHTLQCDSIHSYTDELKQHKLYNQIPDWNGSLNGKNDGTQQQQTCQETTTVTTATTAAGVPIHHTNPFLDPHLYENDKMANNSTNVESMDTISVSSNSDRASSSGVHSAYGGDTDTHPNDEDVFCTENLKKSMPNVAEEEDSEEVKQLKCELEPLIENPDGDNKAIVIINATKQNIKSLLAQPKNPPLLTSVNITIANPQIQNQDLSPEELMIEQQQQNAQLMRTQSVSSVEETATSNWMTPEYIQYKHNLAFPDSVTSSPILTRSVPMKCRRFSVDLSQMRSLRLFFNDENCTSGQLVIASRESQYKILHFHHGGLDHLAQVLHQWHCLLHNIKLAPNGGVGGGGNGGGGMYGGHDEPNLPYRQFMVCRPEVKKSELHPDEGNVNKITTDFFYGVCLNEKGQIEDDLLLRKCVFFGGLEKSLRKAVWPFLLHCYSFNSTFEDRALLMDIRQQEYNELTRRRLYSMSPEEQAHFWRSVQCIIEKDVVRTDRSNPYFAGDDNPNIESMKNILLNYAFYNAGTSYTQGMSDLLAPVLCEIKNESETFWCFCGLMQRAFFVCTPTDNDIDKNLSYLRELIRVMVPKFHTHLEKYSDSKELLFCHRWILLCFKREFTEAVAIRMWEACWSNYLTDYFHLFLCLAIIAVYADDVVAQDLRTDEMLLHFSSLAMYMDGQLILRKARGLLYQFRQLPKIPCTLSNLCRRCGPGMWDSGHHPAIECIGHTDDDHCILSDE